MIPDNYLRTLTPAQLITWVGNVTLATISLMTEPELRRIGFLDNAVVDILYSMTSAGVWISRVNTSGLLTEANSPNIYSSNLRIMTGSHAPTVAGIITVGPGLTDLYRWEKRIAVLPLTLDGAGDVAATALHTGPAGYYPVVRIKRIITDFTDAATTIGFASATGTLVGKDTAVVNFTEDVINTTLLDMLMYNLTDASAITIAVTGGGAAGNLWVEYEYWSET